MRINVENIGCFKNLVDCEKLIHQFDRLGISTHFGPCIEPVDIAIINTCGFTGDADFESRMLIEKYIEYKHSGIVGELWVMGCYSQKRGVALKDEYSEVDRIYGNFDWRNIVRDLGGSFSEDCDRFLTTPQHYAYIKISEGCNMPCSYCIKPKLNGPLKSVPMDEIICECRQLVNRGVREFQLVAQNLTSYGEDIYGEKRIAELVARISDIAGVDWIRLHYAYPTGFPKNLLDVMNERGNVCKYLDMAIQHCSTKMLRIMRRGMTKESLTDLLSEIRGRVPGIYLRTTVMTGHPGETESDYQELKEFVIRQKFERLGVFPYSHQEGSYCHINYSDDIPEKVKRNRALELMALQNKIYREQNDALAGTIEGVIIDSCGSSDTYIGRSEHSTPMADPKVIVRSPSALRIGSFYMVRYAESAGRDIYGDVMPNY